MTALCDILCDTQAIQAYTDALHNLTLTLCKGLQTKSHVILTCVHISQTPIVSTNLVLMQLCPCNKSRACWLIKGCIGFKCLEASGFACTSNMHPQVIQVRSAWPSAAGAARRCLLTSRPDQTSQRCTRNSHQDAPEFGLCFSFRTASIRLQHPPLDGLHQEPD